MRKVFNERLYERAVEENVIGLDSAPGSGILKNLLEKGDTPSFLLPEIRESREVNFRMFELMEESDLKIMDSEKRLLEQRELDDWEENLEEQRKLSLRLEEITFRMKKKVEDFERGKEEEKKLCERAEAYRKELEEALRKNPDEEYRKELEAEALKKNLDEDRKRIH